MTLPDRLTLKPPVCFKILCYISYVIRVVANFALIFLVLRCVSMDLLSDIRCDCEVYDSVSSRLLEEVFAWIA